MGKSIRSKSKLQFKRIKREIISVPVLTERAKRLAEKLEAKNREEKKDEEMKIDAGEEEEEKENNESTKVSTSGWKGSRHETYKRHAKKAKKNSLTFQTKRKSKGKK